MCKYRDFDKTKKLQQIWLDAYTLGSLEIPFKDHLEGYTIYMLLHNYRRYIRTWKLNPIYSDEWTRIHSCRLHKLRVTDTRILIRKSSNREILQKEKVDRFHFPLTSLTLPTNRTDICTNI